MKKQSVLIREFLGTNSLNQSEIKVNRVSESPFINLLCDVMEIKLEDNMDMPYILKANICNENKIKIVTSNGEETFHFYMSTSGQMKKNEAFYIREDAIGVVQSMEQIVSTGKLASLINKETCINKDVIGRLSLLFTGSYRTSIKPNMIIVKDIDFKVNKDVKIFENNELVNKDDFEITQTAFDGCGIMSNEIATRISKDLKMDYVPSWVTVRMPKIAVKGLLSNVDFVRYFNDVYVKDTDTFKKIGNDFFVKDCFGDFQKVDNNTIIINESMAKWSKFYESMAEYETLSNKEYTNTTDRLYIAKIAKKKAKEYTQTSYQSLCAMALTPQALNRLSTPVSDFYHRVLNGEKIAILEMLKLEATVDAENNDEVKVAADKVATLLSIDYDKFIKMNWIKKSLANMIEKKVKELMSGSIPIKGNFKVCVADPIAFMNYILTGSIIPELKENEFYVAGETGVRATMRFPIASPYELTNEILVSNDMMNKYCSFTNEIIVFNQCGIDAIIKSGLDYDGDTVQVNDNENIINSIVECERPFINVLDGGSAKQSYNWQNRIKTNKEFAGNIIGQIAINSAVLCDQIQELGFIENGQVVYFQDLRLRFETNEETYEYMKTLVKLYEMDEEFIKNHFINRFKENEYKINKLVELSMVGIDAPKTGIKPNMDELKAIKGNSKKPRFFHFLPGKEYSLLDCSYVNSVITNHCGFMFNTIWKRTQAISHQYSYMNNEEFKDIMDTLLTQDVNLELANEVIKTVTEMYAKFMYDIKNLKCTDLIEGVETVRYTQDEAKLLYNNMILEQTIVAQELFEEYEEVDVNYAIAILGKDRNKTNTQRFIYSFYFRSIVTALELTNPTVTQLVKNINGEHKGMFDRYDLKEFKNENMCSKQIKKDINNIKRIFDNNIEIRISINSESTIINEVVVEDTNVLLDGNIVGKVFLDSLVKQNITIRDLQGTLKVKNFIKSPSGKSGSLIIDGVA